MPEQTEVVEGKDELRVCCGQLLVSNYRHEHMLCDGEEELYRVGGLTIELD